jgi:hypothetical protein
MIQETNSSFLFEIEAATYRSTSIDQQSQFKRQISIAAEIDNRLGWLVIVQDIKVSLIEIAHKLTMLVCSNKKQTHFVDSLGDREDGLVRLVGIYRGWGSIHEAVSRTCIALCLSWQAACQEECGCETRDPTYVLHSQTIQNLHALPRLCGFLLYMDARRGPKATFGAGDSV